MDGIAACRSGSDMDGIAAFRHMTDGNVPPSAQCPPSTNKPLLTNRCYSIMQ